MNEKEDLKAVEIPTNGGCEIPVGVSTFSGNPSTPLASKETKDFPLTFGQKAVGLTFNPSGDQAVTEAKVVCASAIDQMNNLREGVPQCERSRLASIAITKLQEAQMWMVKAITWKD